MALSYQSILAQIISTVSDIATYTALFLFLLGMKFIRHAADSRGSKIWLVIEVILGTLVLVITVTAVGLILLDRALSGRILFIATMLGVTLIGWSTAGIMLPFEVALGLGKYTWAGLVFGNSVIVVSNVASFFLRIPSLLQGDKCQ